MPPGGEGPRGGGGMGLEAWPCQLSFRNGDGYLLREGEEEETEGDRMQESSCLRVVVDPGLSEDIEALEVYALYDSHKRKKQRKKEKGGEQTVALLMIGCVLLETITS
jgi:hypothetical protein